ncbi:hypothetical protein [Streptomyces sp. NRRL B-24484]|uniref:hypothetical protein n=1 Tax=Streptomyces sp. NRRL B-24484 TaxID=1463833 RepID=UPI000693519D|nr:hypothetical protein [Streptomyces sp. NRRL B-24484]
MYSYDVAPTTRPSAGRTIPGMRPSYDADLPVSPTPIYDALYSEYRRLFRALPGDRTDEEQLRFKGFGGSGGFGGFGGSYPQHQVFETYAGQAHGTPQFLSESRSAGSGHGGRAHGTEHQQGRLATQAVTVGHQAGPTPAGHASAGHGATGHTAGHAVGGTGQGWVAAGYLGQQPTTAGGGGRHRSLLSLPPGRSGEQSL